MRLDSFVFFWRYIHCLFAYLPPYLLLPYLFTSLLTYLLKNRPIPFPAGGHEVTKPSFSFCVSILHTYIHLTYQLHSMPSTTARHAARSRSCLFLAAAAEAPSIISSADIYRDLHRLPINQRISYKISLLTWKALYTAEPAYLSELISPYVPARTLRSSNTYLLAITMGVTSHFSSRSFSVSAPSTWNSLPQHIRSIDRLSTFKRQLKSHFFQSAFTV